MLPGELEECAECGDLSPHGVRDEYGDGVSGWGGCLYGMFVCIVLVMLSMG